MRKLYVCLLLPWISWASAGCGSGSIAANEGKNLPEDGASNDVQDPDSDPAGLDKDPGPVMVLFVMDASGGVGVADEAGQRIDAIRAVIARVKDTADVRFSVIRFNTWVDELTPGFVQLSGHEQDVFGPDGLVKTGSSADFHGALGSAYGRLRASLSAVESDMRARTRVAVIFLAANWPYPVCHACVTTPPDHALFDTYCLEDYSLECGPICGFGMQGPGECTYPNCGVPCQSGGLLTFDLREREAGELPLLQNGMDYNTDTEILAQAENLVELEQTLGVGEVRLHTFFLRFEPMFGFQPEQTADLLKNLAGIGNGLYREFDSAEFIDFAEVDLRPLDP